MFDFQLLIDSIFGTVLWAGGFVLFLFLFVFLGIRLFKLWMRWDIVNQHKNGMLLKISLPKYRRQSDEPNQRTAQVKSKSNVAEQMFAELRGIIPSDWRKHLIFRETLSFEIVANATEINFYVFCSNKLETFVKNTIFAAYPEAEIVQVDDYFDKLLLGGSVHTGYVRLIGPEYAPIRTYDTIVSDSLNTILNKMVNLKGDEMIAVQTYVTPVSGSWRKRAFNFLSYLRGKESQTSQDGKTNNNQPTIDRDVYSGVEKKMSKKGYLVGVRIVSKSSDPILAQANFESVARSYTQFDTPALTSFQSCRFGMINRTLLSDYKLRMQSLINWPIFKEQFVANTEELASIFHFPGEEVEVPKVAWQRFTMASAPGDIPTDGLFLGYNKFRGDKKKIYCRDEDRRKHFYIVGQTGTGKSEYLKHMILEDIKRGAGLAFIDPHGDVAEDIIRKIPEDRLSDVVYWNPGDTEYPIGLNIMDVKTTEQKNIIINAFIALLYKLYDPARTGIMGPMLERTVRNIMLTAMEEEGSTLIEAMRLLTSPEFAKSKISAIKDSILKTYWTEEMARTTDFHKSETLGYYVSKFDRFVSDTTLRNIIGQSKSAIDFGEIMNEGKILIINLSKGNLGEENSSFLGTMLIPKFMMAAMQRSSILESQRKDFYLYVDEFQNFSTPDFAEMLSEARKYRLNLIVANQYISQIREDIRNAVFGNVGTIGAFRVGVDDSKYLVNQFKPIFNEFDLINNGVGNMYLKLQVNGKPTDAFSVGLEWSEIKSIVRDEESAQVIIESARSKYAKPRLEVEKTIIERAGLIN